MFRLINNISVSLVLLLTLLPLGTALAGDIQTVRATGSGAIVKGDIALARKMAIADAKRNAVEQVGSKVVSKTVVENFDLVRDRVVMMAEGYIHEYKVLDERKDRFGLVVEIEARVSKSSIAEDSDRIYIEMQRPRVMVLVPEVSGAGKAASGYAENVISEFLVAKRFNVVDRATVRQIARADELRLIAEGDADAAASLGRRVGAEVIVAGSAVVGSPESVRGILYANKATVSIKALRTDNASVYAVSNMNRTASEATPDAATRKALESAGRKAAKDVFWKIVKKWNAQKEQGAEIEVVISGIDFSGLRRIIKALKPVDGVVDVIQRSFDPSAAVLSVVYKGKAMDLAARIDEMDMQGMDIEVQSVSAGRLELSVKR